jgi:hypothetical protein
MGHVEVLYVTELIGIALIWIGYRFNVRPNAEDTPLEKVRSEFTR